MSDDDFETVLVPILRELRGHLASLTVIGGWVPELHRRFGSLGEWAVRPLRTTEVDVLLPPLGGNAPGAASISATLAAAGFTPVTTDGPSAVWERDSVAGERIEFFVEHRGAWDSLTEIVPVERAGQLGALGLSDVGVLREHSVLLAVPVHTVAGAREVVMVRLPELGAFAVHKGATFRQRRDRPKRVKDLHYIVDVMQSGDAVVDLVERQVLGYCAVCGPLAALARTARNQVGLVVRDSASADLVLGLGEALAARHGVPAAEGMARARGYLTDFLEIIPEECG